MIKFNKKAINHLNNYFKLSSIPLGIVIYLSFLFMIKFQEIKYKG